MAKKSKFTGKSLYDIVTTKSKKFLNKLLAPIEKAKLKRRFEDRVSEAVAAFYESKAAEIEMLMEVKNIDVDSILEQNEIRTSILTDINGICRIYLNTFGEELEPQITDADLDVSTIDVLSQAKELEDEDDED